MVVVDYPAMGARIRQFRKEKGMLQSDLAAVIGMSSITISHIECGSGKPEPNTLVKIANALDVSMDMLLSDSLAGGRSVHFEELDALLADCSGTELKMICDVVRALLKAYRREEKGNETSST